MVAVKMTETFEDDISNVFYPRNVSLRHSFYQFYLECWVAITRFIEEKSLQKKKNISHLKMGAGPQKGNYIVFQPSIFRCKLAVIGRVYFPEKEKILRESMTGVGCRVGWLLHLQASHLCLRTNHLEVSAEALAKRITLR